MSVSFLIQTSIQKSRKCKKIKLKSIYILKWIDIFCLQVLFCTVSLNCSLTSLPLRGTVDSKWSCWVVIPQSRIRNAGHTSCYLVHITLCLWTIIIFFFSLLSLCKTKSRNAHELQWRWWVIVNHGEQEENWGKCSHFSPFVSITTKVQILLSIKYLITGCQGRPTNKIIQAPPNYSPPTLPPLCPKIHRQACCCQTHMGHLSVQGHESERLAGKDWKRMGQEPDPFGRFV